MLNFNEPLFLIILNASAILLCFNWKCVREIINKFQIGVEETIDIFVIKRSCLLYFIPAIIYVEIDSLHVCGAIHHLEHVNTVCAMNWGRHVKLWTRVTTSRNLGLCLFKIRCRFFFWEIYISGCLFGFQERSNLKINMQSWMKFNLSTMTQIGVCYVSAGLIT